MHQVIPHLKILLILQDILQVSNVLVPEAFERIYSKIMQMPLEHAQRELENNFPT